MSHNALPSYFFLYHQFVACILFSDFCAFMELLVCNVCMPKSVSVFFLPPFGSYFSVISGYLSIVLFYSGVFAFILSYFIVVF